MLCGQSLPGQQSYAGNLPSAQQMPTDVHSETCKLVTLAIRVQARLHLICHITQDLNSIFPPPHFAVHIYQGIVRHHVWLTALVLRHN